MRQDPPSRHGFLACERTYATRGRWRVANGAFGCGTAGIRSLEDSSDTKRNQHSLLLPGHNLVSKEKEGSPSGLFCVLYCLEGKYQGS